MSLYSVLIKNELLTDCYLCCTFSSLVFLKILNKPLWPPNDLYSILPPHTHTHTHSWQVLLWCSCKAWLLIHAEFPNHLLCQTAWRDILIHSIRGKSQMPSSTFLAISLSRPPQRGNIASTVYFFEKKWTHLVREKNTDIHSKSVLHCYGDSSHHLFPVPMHRQLPVKKNIYISLSDSKKGNILRKKSNQWIDWRWHLQKEETRISGKQANNISQRLMQNMTQYFCCVVGGQYMFCLYT